MLSLHSIMLHLVFVVLQRKARVVVCRQEIIKTSKEILVIKVDDILVMNTNKWKRSYKDTRKRLDEKQQLLWPSNKHERQSISFHTNLDQCIVLESVKLFICFVTLIILLIQYLLILGI